MNTKKKCFIESTLKNANYSGKITGFSECIHCGECCLTNACSCVPEEFPEITVESIEALLDSKKYMITASYEMKNERSKLPIRAIPHISAREINCPENGINITMLHSKCAMYENGCKFSEDDRPVQGLLLIPEGNGCKPYVDIPDWEAYNDILETVVMKRTGKCTQEIFEEGFLPFITNLKRRIQTAVVYGKSITVQEKMAAEVLDGFGAFTGLFGNEIGAAIHDFIDMTKVDSLK